MSGDSKDYDDDRLSGSNHAASTSGRRIRRMSAQPHIRDSGVIHEAIPTSASSHAPTHQQGHERSKSHILSASAERLNSERLRANTAEQRLKETLETLRTVIEVRDRTMKDYARTSEELRLWKIQLDNARAELRHGQEAITKLEEERDTALEAAAKDRSMVRKLQLERAVWKARDEGWALGYEEGVRAAQKGAAADMEMRRRLNMKQLGEVDGFSDDGKKSHGRSTETSRHGANSPPRRPSSRLHLSGEGSHRPLPDAPRSPSGTRPPRSSIAQPVLSPRADQTRGVLIQNSTAIGPLSDGFIPTADSHSFISIPPPHDLDNRSRSPAGSPVLGPGANRDYAVAGDTQSAIHRSPSAMSRGSTHVSQHPMVRAPSPEEVVRPLSVRNRTPSSQKDQSPSQKIAQQWREADPDDAPVIPSSIHRSSSRPDSRHDLRVHGMPEGPSHDAARSTRSPPEDQFRRNPLSRMNSSEIDIQVVAPSQSPSNASLRTLATAHQPHLLSPNQEALPVLPPSNETANWQQPVPMPAPVITFPPADVEPIVLPTDVLPAGFIPLAMTPSRSAPMALQPPPHSPHAPISEMGNAGQQLTNNNSSSTPYQRRMSVGGAMSPGPFDHLPVFKP